MPGLSEIRSFRSKFCTYFGNNDEGHRTTARNKFHVGFIVIGFEIFLGIGKQRPGYKLNEIQSAKTDSDLCNWCCAYMNHTVLMFEIGAIRALILVSNRFDVSYQIKKVLERFCHIIKHSWVTNSELRTLEWPMNYWCLMVAKDMSFCFISGSRSSGDFLINSGGLMLLDKF